MRETRTTLIKQAHQYTGTTVEAGTIDTFLSLEINRAARWIYTDLREYIGHKTQTTSTVDDQQNYHYPPDLSSLENVYITISSKDYTMVPVDSAQRWSRLNAIDPAGTAIPSYFYPRRDDFGIYPVPQDAYTMTIEYNYILKDMENTDYTTGTVTVTNNSAAVTGSGTSWSGNVSAAQWFQSDDGLWYRIESIDTGTTLTLESVYEGSTSAGASYTIGDSPEIPTEFHELLAYRAAARYYGGFRKDASMAAYWENMFWTGDGTNNSRAADEAVGGYLGAKEKYTSRSDSAIVYKDKKRFTDPFVDRLFAAEVSTA